MTNGRYTIDKLCEKLKKSKQICLYLDISCPLQTLKTTLKNAFRLVFHVETESGIKNCLSAETKALERYKGSKIVKMPFLDSLWGL